MHGHRPRLLRRLLNLPRLTAGVWAAGLPLLGLACNQFAPSVGMTPPAVARGAAPEEITLLPPPDQIPQAAPAPRPAGKPGQPENIPAQPRPAQGAPAQVVEAGDKAAPKVVPISLDTVFRLAQDQNANVGVYRERVNEAYGEAEVAALHWLPDVWIGTSYYRHEGGIADEFGRLDHSSFGSLFGGVELDSQFDIKEYAYHKVTAERKVWQQKTELSRITSETLMDACNTYVDLLAALQAVAVIRDTDKEMQNLHKQAKDLAEAEGGTRVEVARVNTELANRERMILHYQTQAAEARAKLAYLLGLNPVCDLLPVEHRLVALDLVNADTPACDLATQALTYGPGIREMEGMLALVHDSIERAKGPGKFMPVFGVRMAEGVFGTGPGSTSDWDNRWDINLQARWNLTELAGLRDRRRVAQARLNQLHLSYDDLRGKLTAGVADARDTILGDRQQFKKGEEQIRNAKDTVRLAQDRLKDLPVERKAPSEVLFAIQSQMGAQLTYLNTLRDYDKAELRLLILLGQAPYSENGHCNGH